MDLGSRKNLKSITFTESAVCIRSCVCDARRKIPVRKQFLVTFTGWRVLLTIATLLLFATACFAQELGTGLISGEVSDPAGAVVRNAQVTAVQKSTGLERKTTTNGAGFFAINSLAPGTYELRVVATGFADYVSPLQLEVGQQSSFKVRLGVQTQQTVINIDDTGSIPLVDTTSSTVDAVVNAEQIDNLPLNGRNFLELALLTPGNTIAPNFDPTKQGTVVISSAGQLGRGG
ncbi:MAG: hypothetical protein DMG79_08015, partial [Acidobacteria bacterium]